MIRRGIKSQLEKVLFKGKVIILYGARQVGKTTLVKEIMSDYSDSSLYLNCDETDIRSLLSDTNSTTLKSHIGNKSLIIIDEAQRVENIGLTLKLLIDNYPHLQIIATGSSSFELSNKVIEPLTGRKIEFHLFPISSHELALNSSELEVNRLLETHMIYGMYPEVLSSDTFSKEELVRSLSKSYLYKDILAFKDIRHPEVLEKLLQALALQMGNEVSYNELSNLTGVDKNTVSSYIQLLEKSFIVFRLNSLSRNLRNELKKSRKIYFYDNGIRNAIVNNFNPLHLRNDTGALWENFLISERLKFNSIKNRFVNAYFWRTHSQQEIDYIEDAQGYLDAFEFKFNSKKFSKPKSFSSAYPNSSISLINQENYLSFVS